MLRSIYTYFLLLSVGLYPVLGTAQSGVCDNNTPFFEVDLTSAATMTYISPSVVRKGRCCGEVGPPPPRCIEFEVTLHPDALGLSFNIYSGAIPSGAMYYQVNCGDPIPVGDPVCLAGVGPHTVTFCKPGGNENEYSIESFEADILTYDTEVRAGCQSTLETTGFIEPTIEWTDITSGTGAYDIYLGCTSGCATTTVSPDYNAPDTIQYQVCGDIQTDLCGTTIFRICDTLMVVISPGFTITNLPDTVEFCNSEVNKYIEIIPDQPDYTYYYYWNNGPQSYDNTFSIVDPGIYTVIVVDSAWAHCSRDSLTYIVDFYETYAEIVEPNPICPGESTSLVAANPIAGNTYQWDFGVGAVPETATGPGPHSVTFPDCAEYTILLNTNDGDCEGNDTLFYQVEDAIAPVFNQQPSDITVDCNAIPNALALTVTDDCADNIPVSYSESIIGSGCVYTIMRTWSATDDCGNSASHSRSITVVDVTAPSLSGVPSNITVNCNSIPVVATVTATDNCSSLVIPVYTEIVGTGCPYTITRTWTATDDCGNSTMQTQEITVEDTASPVLSGVPNNVTVECSSIPVVATVTATDNCSSLVIPVYTEIVGTGCPYTITRSWTATDDCGNSTIQTQVITVEDTESPVMSGVPIDVTVDCNSMLVVANVIATDNCSSLITPVYTEVVGTGCPYTITRTWTATDACGNSTIQTQVITVEDTEPPLLSGVPSDVIVDCNTIPVATNVTATDNCSNLVTPVYTEVIGSGCPYTILRTWTATDACGNSMIQTQVITVEDTEPPLLSGVPSDITVDCNTIPSVANVSAIDNCSSSVTPVYTELVGTGCPYTITRSWTATDDCGNSTRQTQEVTVEDTESPVLSGVPRDVTVDCNTIPNAANVRATDNCSSSVTPVYSEVVGTGCPYTITRSWTATDECGNSTTQTQEILVEDTESPVLNGVPNNVTVDCNTIPSAANVVATDNCSSSVTPVYSEVVGTGCPYTITRSWTATDECGNSTTQTQEILVEDTESPVLSGVPNDVTVDCNTIPIAATVVATDNCSSSVTPVYSEVVGTGCPYTITRSWTATDECGNSTVQTQEVTVEDSEPPVLSGVPSDVTVDCNTIPSVASVIATDNCSSSVTPVYSEVVGTGCPYTITRSWTATDECGNSTVQTQEITVEDSEPPVLSGVPSDVTVDCNTIPIAATVNATDNCSSSVTPVYAEVVGTGCPYTITRSWTATDECGNSTVQTQEITVEDSESPALSGVPSDVTVDCNTIPSAANVVATDNCSSSVTPVYVEVVGTGCPYTITRSWTATDECGNSTVQTQEITVEDSEPPVLSGVPSDVTVDCNTIPSAANVVATDNCSSSVTPVYVEVVGTGCPYTITRSWTATDECGNSTVQTQEITVEDSEPPVLSGVPSDVTVDCNTIPSAANVVATDNCSNSVTPVYTEVVGTGCPYTITRTWTATDECGNSTVQTQEITVEDTESPVLSGVPNDVTVDCNTIPSAAAVIATDNCSSSVTPVYTEVVGTGCPYTITRTWTATDECGNSTVETQEITVEDTESPVLSNVPNDVTVDCNTIPSVATVIATDNCSSSVTPVYIEVVGTGCPYTIIRTWTATDECGNSTTRTQEITVEDTESPVLSGVPSDVTVDCNTIPSAENVIATDNCDVNVLVGFTEEVGDGCPFLITRTWTAIDDCGNTSSATQIITVEDQTPPTLSFSTPDTLSQIGYHILNNNTTLQSGNLANVNQNWISVSFNEAFPTQPIVFTQIITQNSQEAVNSRIRNVTTTGFEVRIQEEENADGIHAGETVSWIAMEIGYQSSGFKYEANSASGINENWTTLNFVQPYSFSPIFIAAFQSTNDLEPTSIRYKSLRFSSVDIFAEEEESLDAETTHADEVAGYFVAQTAGDILDVNFGEIGEVGKVVFEQLNSTSWQTVTLNRTYSNPSIIAGPISYNNNEPATIRIQNVTGNSFQIQVDEWDYQDGGHPIETISYIVIGEAPSNQIITNDSTIVENSRVRCDSIPEAATAFATDDCSNAIIDFSEVIDSTSGNNDCTYTIIRTWIATDECGNSSFHTQEISVEDHTSPSIDWVASDTTVICSTVPPPVAPIVSDICGQNVSLSYQEDSIAGSGCPVAYTLRRVWTATDVCGNTSQATQLITVEDDSSPSFDWIASDTTVICSTIPPPVAPIVSDICGHSVSLSYQEDSIGGSGCPVAYTLRRVWTATDICGNTSQATQLITVEDDSSPSFDWVASDTTVICSTIPTAVAPVVSDICGHSVSLSYQEDSIAGSGCPVAYTLRRVWTATDVCGNTSQATQLITVEDDSSPSFDWVASDTTVNCSTIPTVVAPIVSDICGHNVSLSYQEDSIAGSGCPVAYTLRRVWTATDVCGNTSQVTQLITVEDDSSPSFDWVASDTTVICSTVPTAAAPIVSDICGHSVSLSYQEDSIAGSGCPVAYTLRRVWTATDVCGNTSQATQLITVEDDSSPSFDWVASDTTVNCSTIPTAVAPIVSDICGHNVSLSYQEDSIAGSGCPVAYTLRRVWTATDVCGNTSQATQLITVEDDSSPSFDWVASDTTVICSTVPTAVAPVVSDICGHSVSLSYQEDSIAGSGCPVAYTLRRVWTATDVCGNTSQATQLITVEDDSSPSFDWVASDTTVNCSTVPTAVAPVVSDICGHSVSLSYQEDSIAGSGCPVAYTLRRVWTATDVCGNSSQATQLITVEDDSSPSFDWVASDTTVNCSTIPTAVAPIVSDICGHSVSLSYQEDSIAGSGCPVAYTLRRVWTATDVCGNSSQATQLITVEDDSSPSFDWVASDTTVNCSTIPTAVAPVVSDICGHSVSLSYQEDSIAGSGCPVAYTLRRVWTATDVCGNTSQATQLIVVEDYSAPEVSNIPVDLTIECGSIPGVTAPVFEDVCGSPISIDYDENESYDSCIGSYTLVRTWTAEDICGNDTTVTQHILVYNCPTSLTATVSPANPICEGEQIVFTASIDTASYDLYFQWQFSTDGGVTWSDIPGATDSLYIINSVGTTHEGTYRAKVSRTEDGLNSTFCHLISNEIPLIVIEENIDNELLELAICQGETVEIGESTYSNTGVFIDTISASNGCDSALVTLDLTVYPIYDTTLVVSICYGSTYEVGSSSYSQTGLYNNTLQSVNGCDSLVTLDLTILPEVRTDLVESVCYAGSYTIGGTIYTTTGMYSETLTAVNGCDSLVTLELTILPEVRTDLVESVCYAGSYTIGDSTYTTTGMYSNTLTAANGCDSLVTLDLTILPEVRTDLVESVCYAGSYTIGSSTYTTTGMYSETLTAVNGCDSLVTLDLTILPEVRTDLVESVCYAGSYTIGSSTYTTTGMYSNTLTAANGCDSLVTLDLTILPEVRTDLVESVCYAGSYTIGGTIYTTAGMYSETLTASNGCDSLVTLDLTILPEVRTDLVESVCYAGSYTIGGSTYTTTGMYSETLTAANGCDSLVTLDLTILPEVRTDLVESVCYAGSYTIGSSTYTTTGMYNETLTAANGCDSLVTLDLTILPEVRMDLVESVCYGGSYTIGSSTYTTTGMYSETLTAVNGCDSLVTLDLTILPEVRTDLVESVCYAGSYTIGSSTYTATGMYSETLTGANGCDSLVTLDLTILPEVRTDLVESVCYGGSYTIGSSTYTATGMYSETLTASNGCDSLVTLDLTILPEVRTDLVESVCYAGSYTIGGSTYTTTGMYSETLTASNGCDSLVTLDLTILPEVRTDLVESVCYAGSYTIGGSTYTTTGMYSETLTAANGCDSLVTLDLTILPEVRMDLVESVCYGGSYTIGGTTYTTTGMYSETLTAVNGCDSLVTLDLTILPYQGSTQFVDLCEGDEYNGVAYFSNSTLSNVLPAANGCDSIVITNLVIHFPYQINAVRELCEGSSYNGATYFNDTTIIENYISIYGCDSIITRAIQIKDVINDTRTVDLCEGEAYEGQIYTNDTSLVYNLTSLTGCDSIVTRNLVIHEISITNLTEEICAGESYSVGTSTYTSSGMYSDLLSNVNGCDSTVNLSLTVRPENMVNLSETLCYGDTAWLGNNYYTTTAIHSAVFTDSFGCDSTVYLNLTILPQVRTSLVEVLCYGDSISIGNVFYATSGSYTDTLSAINGCDSIIDLQLTIAPIIRTNLAQTLCDGFTYTVSNNIYDTTGIFIDTLNAVNGCDSIVMLDLNVLPVFETNLVEQVCYGGSYTIGSQTYTSNGTYTNTLTAVNGCDSVVNLDLTMLPLNTNFELIELCQGEVYQGVTYTQNASLLNTYTDTNSCDSIVNTAIVVYPTYDLSQSVSLCEGGMFNGVAHFNDTTYVIDTLSINGCDSSYTYTINVTQTIETTIPIQLCANELYNGVSYSQDTILVENYNSNQGCDSIVYYTIEVNEIADSNLIADICQGDSYTVGATTYTTSGNYVNVLTASNGCDSTVYLALMVHTPDVTNEAIYICPGDTIDGQTYFANTTLTTTYSNSQNCDSTVHSNIYIYPTYNPIFNVSTCDNEPWEGTIYLTDTTLVDSFQTINGCDSVVIINLSVNPTQDETIDVNLCHGQVYQGIAYFNDTMVIDTLLTGAGCQRILRHDIEVANTILTDLVDTICLGESITVGNSNYTSSGNFSNTLTAENGCDSLVQLTLTVLEPLRDTLRIAICDGDLHNGVAYSTNTILTDTYMSVAGCDSIVRTEITVFENHLTVIPVELCEEDWFNGFEMHTDTVFVDSLQNSNGCDSVVNTLVSVHPKEDVTISVGLCNGQEYLGVVYSSDTLLIDTLSTSNGCERIVRHNIQVTDAIVNDLIDTICLGESYVVANTSYTSSGNYTNTVTANGGCDSIINLTLTVLDPIRDTLEVALCEGEQYEGVAYSSNTILTDTYTSVAGCDSIVRTEIEVHTPQVTAVALERCEGELFAGIELHSDTLFTDSLQTVHGCDSIVRTVITVHPTETQSTAHSLCYGTAFQGIVYAQDTLLIDTFQTANGCDRYEIHELTIHLQADTTIVASICQGDTYTVGSSNYTTSGNYTNVLNTNVGCDSTIYLELAVVAQIRDTLEVALCEGEQYEGVAYSSNTILTDTYTSVAGCDSIVRTEIEVHTPQVTAVALERCEGELFAGIELHSDTLFTDSLQTVHGCDSVVRTVVTVHPTETQSTAHSLCYGTAFQGIVYAQDTLLIDTLQTSNGCDRYEIHELTIHLQADTTIVASICQGDTYTIGSSNYTTSGNYTNVLTTNAGCDSTIYLELAVVAQIRDTLEIALCEGEQYEGVTYSSNTILTDTYTSVAGCDSIVRTEIEVHNPQVTAVALERCEGELFAGIELHSDTLFTDSLQTVHGCDSIVRTVVTVHPTETQSTAHSLCYGTAFQGVVYAQDTLLIDTFQTSNGCDRYEIHELTIHFQADTTIVADICQGEIYTVGLSNYTTSGNYTDVLSTPQGCDSTIYLSLTVLEHVRDTIAVDLCAGETYNGTAYNSNTILTESYPSTIGCDSIITTIIEVSPKSFSSFNYEICAGDSLFLGNGFQTIGGTYYDTLSNQYVCDSIIVSTLVVNLCPSDVFVDVELCAGDSIFLENAYRTQSGTYVDTYTGIYGQDSTVTTTLTVLSSNIHSDQVMICEGDSLFVGGAYQTVNGQYTDVYMGANGCDSIILTELIVHPRHEEHIAVNICEGESVMAGGAVQTVSGIYYDNLVNMYGCDSIIITNVLVNRVYDTLHISNICAGDSLLFGVDYYTEEGTYHYTYQTQHGCDSIVQLNLAVDELITTADFANICDGDSLLLAGAYQTEHGFYTDTYTAVGGCDSLVITELIVNQPYTSTITAEICEGEFYLAGGQQQSSSGQYADTIPDVNGCNNIFITNLIVHPTKRDTAYYTLCEGESLFAGGALQTITGIYVDSLQSTDGCDSLQYTNIRFLEHTEETVSISLCEGERFFVANNWQTSNGIYHDTLINSNGCDSVLITDLTFLQPETTEVAVDLCAGDSLIVDGVYQTTSGTYTEILTSSYGCDSIIQMQVTVIDHFEHFVQETICAGDSILLNGSYYFEAGSYEDHYTSVAGCDSIVITELEVEDRTDLLVDDEYICYGEEVELFVHGSDVVEWSPRTGLSCSSCPNPLASPTETTTYTVSAKTCLGATVQQEVTVYVSEAPELYVPIQATDLARGDSVLLEAWTDDPTAVLIWSQNGEIICRDCRTITVSPEQSRAYRVTVENELGCSVAHEVNVRVNNACKYSSWEIPNIISPNGDGQNDQFQIKYEGVSNIRLLRIYNRWGEKIFETNDINKTWDGTYRGKVLNPGVYIYYIEGVCLDDEDFTKTGNITVLR